MQSVDFDRFHQVDLPDRLAAGNGLLAAADVGWLGPIAFRRTEGGAYTYVPTDDSVDVVEGDEDARTVIEIDDESWQGLAQDFETAPGLIYSGRVSCPRGDMRRFLRWEPGLRAMFHGRPIFDPDTDLADRNGSRLDTERGFDIADLDDPEGREDMAHFLRTTGCLWVKDVLDRPEVDAFLEGAARVRAAASEGDQRSWWGKNSSDEAVLCRVTHAGGDPAFGGLHDDARVRRLVDLSDHPLTSREGRTDRSITVLWKNPDMSEGLSDLPWHRDCGMGGHAAMCPTLVMTICLTDGSAAAGELRMLPGSWQESYPFIDGTDERAPRGVSLPVTAGDLTMHYSDIMHASMPPTSAEGPHRISVLLGFARPDAYNHLGEESYNDVLLGDEEGQIEHLGQRLDQEAAQ